MGSLRVNMYIHKRNLLTAISLGLLLGVLPSLENLWIRQSLAQAVENYRVLLHQQSTKAQVKAATLYEAWDIAQQYARTWSKDAALLSLMSTDVNDANAQQAGSDGRRRSWQAVFTSPALNKQLFLQITDGAVINATEDGVHDPGIPTFAKKPVIDSPEALQRVKALKADFAASVGKGKGFHFLLQMSPIGEPVLTLVGSAKTTNGDQAPFSFTLDPQTGQIVSSQDRSNDLRTSKEKPSIRGRLSLTGQSPAHIVLDHQAIYWVAWPGFQKIYRYPLVAAAQTPVTITVVATSHYPAGVLVQAPLLRTGDWLIFHDSAHAAISSTWQLRAFNLTNGTERILAESKDNAIVYGIAAANNRVAWSWLDHHAERPCQDETVLSLLDLATNQQIELNRACFQTEHHWGTVSMDGNRLVADFWRENIEPGKILGDIVLFDLSAPDPTQFVFLKASPPARINSLPRLTGQWVSWVRGTQSQGNCVLFNLQTQTQRALPTEWSQTSCQFVDAAAGWFWNLDSANTPNILLYQPDQQRSVRLRLHTQGHIEAAAIMDNTIVVAVKHYPEHVKVIKSVIEWTHLYQP